MIIENAQWSKSPTVPDGSESQIIGFLARINGMNVCVPKDINNMHYAEAMRQVAAGSLTIEEAD